MARTADVVIIGAGIQGCSAALHCRQRSLSVIVVEKDHAGRHASGVNAGGVRRLNRHPAEIPLSVASMQIWHGIEDLLGDDCGFHVSGQVRVAETPDDLETLKARAQQVRKPYCNLFHAATATPKRSTSSQGRFHRSTACPKAVVSPRAASWRGRFAAG